MDETTEAGARVTPSTQVVSNGHGKATFTVTPVAVIISKPTEQDENTSCDDDNDEDGKHLTSSLTTTSSRKETRRRKCERISRAPTSSASNETTTYQRPPDGGWGWWVVLASFMINFICDGISFSFGIFFVDLLDIFKESKSKTAWVGSLFLSIPLIAGPVASALTDHFGCRKMAISGSVLASAGFFLGTFATSIDHLLITFSVSGLGMALCYVTSIVSVAYYFEKRRSLATGLAVCGSGFGTMLFPPFSIFLLRSFQWQKTFNVLGVIFLTICCFAFLIRDLDIDMFLASRDVSSSESEEEDDEEEEDDDSQDEDDTLDIETNSGINTDFFALTPSPLPIEWRRHDSSGTLSDHPTTDEKSKGSGRRKCHFSESLDTYPGLARTSTSLINIPTFIGDVEAGGLEFNAATLNETEFGEMFRRGGHLSNLIRFYPHLLDYFLPAGMDSNEKVVSGTSEVTDKAKSVTINNVIPATSNRETPAKIEEERRVVEFTLPEGTIDSFEELAFRRDSIAANGNSISSPNIVNKETNGHVNVYQEVLRKSTGQLYNFRPGIHRQHHNMTAGGDGGNTLRKLRLQRGSLTYRGAMLVIGSKYRLKASSAPDIYRTSMATINGESKAFTILENIKDIVCDMFDLSNFKSFRYALFCLSNFLLYICVDVPYVHLPDHVVLTGAADEAWSSWLISIIGIFNTMGVVFVGYIGDKPFLDASFVYALFISISGLSLAAVPLCGTSYWLIAMLCALYGFTISANYSLVSVILVELISLDSFTNAYGMLLLVQGFGSLLGPPVAGWLFDTYASYDGAFYLTGLLVTFSGLLTVPICKKKNCFLWPEGRRRMAKSRRCSSSISRSSSSASFQSKKSASSVSLLFSNIPLSEVGVNGSNLSLRGSSNGKQSSLKHRRNGKKVDVGNNGHLKMIVEEKNDQLQIIDKIACGPNANVTMDNQTNR